MMCKLPMNECAVCASVCATDTGHCMAHAVQYVISQWDFHTLIQCNSQDSTVVCTCITISVYEYCMSVCDACICIVQCLQNGTITRTVPRYRTRYPY